MDIFTALGNGLKRFYDLIHGSLDILATAIEIPLDLVTVLPEILGISVLVVVFVMVVKFILGR